MRKLLKSFVLPVLTAWLGACAPDALAATCTATTAATQPRNWGTAGTWLNCGGGVPANNDNVVIPNGATVILNVDSNRVNDLTINAGGTLRGDNTNNSITMNNGAGTDITNNGTIDFGQGNLATIFMRANSQWAGAGTWNLGVIDLDGNALTFAAGSSMTINMSGAASPIINAGTVTSLTAMTWNFTGSVAQTLPGGTAVDYGNVTVGNTAGTTLGVALSAANILGNLTVTPNGILNNGGFAVTLVAAKNLDVQAGARLNLTGTSTMATVSGGGTKTFAATSTVNYGGTNQAVTAETYGNLTMTGSGTKTVAAGTTNIVGNFTLATGVTYNGTTNNPVVNLAGNFSNAGTFNSGTGIYTFNGTAAQTLNGATTFSNMAMNNAAGLTLAASSPVTLSNVLTLTTGVVSTGLNTLITTANCAGSIARTGGWINGNLQKRIPAGASTCTFEVGDAGNYAPVVTTFPATTTAGNLTASTSIPDHPNIGTSSFHPVLTANRWWTLTNGGVGGLGTGYSAAFNFVAGDLDAGTSPANNFEVQRFAAATWNNTTLGTRTGTSTQATGLTLFGDFAVGERVIPLNGLQAFNAYDHCTSSCGIGGVIKTKIAGTDFGSASGQLDIVAINSAGTAIETSFKGYVRIELVNAATGGGACGSMTSIQTLSPNPEFLAADLGRYQNINLTENDSWANVKVRITYPASGAAPVTVACSTDAFAIRPDRLVINARQDTNWTTAGTSRNLANTGAAGGVVHKAGQPFTMIATAQNSLGNTTGNYAGSPTGSASACAVANTGCTSSFGTVTPGTWSASAGTVTTSTASYSEVGAFGLQLQDTTFSDVDLADGSTAVQRNIPLSAKVDIGRFVPDHFVVTTNNTPKYKTFNTNDASCTGTAPRRTFTYIGQAFGWATPPQALITAQNAANGTTVNYNGTLWKLVATDVTETYSSVPATLDMSLQGTPAVASSTVPATYGTGTSVSAAAGTFLYTRTTPQAAFDANISLTVSVQDASDNSANQGIITTTTSATFNGSGTGIAFDGGGAANGAEFRYGRMRVNNSYGSELLPLPVPVSAQYWNGSAFVANTADNCTSLAAANFAQAAPATGSTITTTIQGSSTLSGGAGRITLTKPTGPVGPSGVIPKGSVDVSSTIPYLIPGLTGHETFGIYKSGPVIYMREMY